MVQYWYPGGHLAHSPVHKTESVDLCCSHAAAGVYAALHPSHSSAAATPIYLAGTIKSITDILFVYEWIQVKEINYR